MKKITAATTKVKNNKQKTNKTQGKQGRKRKNFLITLHEIINVEENNNKRVDFLSKLVKSLCEIIK